MHLEHCFLTMKTLSEISALESQLAASTKSSPNKRVEAELHVKIGRLLEDSRLAATREDGLTVKVQQLERDLEKTLLHAVNKEREDAELINSLRGKLEQATENRDQQETVQSPSQNKQLEPLEKVCVCPEVRSILFISGVLVTCSACSKIQVKTMYELAINEISESSQKAKRILQAQHERDRQMLEASAQVL